MVAATPRARGKTE
jgi:hypothetical protein